MIGIIFFLALGTCLWGCLWLAKTLSNLVPNPKWRGTVDVGIFLALLASPFVDEVIAMYQFEALCKANGLESADVSKAKGRRVIQSHSDRTYIKGTIMPIKVSNDTFRDADSGEVLIQSKNYFAYGGWLMRYTPLSMNSSDAMLFKGNGCGWDKERKILSNNQIVQIN